MKCGQVDRECADAARESTAHQTHGVKIPLSVSTRIPETRSATPSTPRLQRCCPKNPGAHLGRRTPPLYPPIDRISIPRKPFIDKLGRMAPLLAPEALTRCPARVQRLAVALALVA